MEKKIQTIEQINLFKENLERQFDLLGDKAFENVTNKVNIDFYDRLLATDYLPSKEKEEEAKKLNINLGAVIDLLDFNKILPLHKDIGEIIKNEIRRIRTMRLSETELKKEQEKISKTVLEIVIKKLPENQKNLLNGVWQLRFYTFCKKPERTKGLTKEVINIQSLDKSDSVKNIDSLKSESIEDSDIKKIAEMIDLSEVDWKALLKSLSSDKIPELISETISDEKTDKDTQATKRNINFKRIPNDLEKLRLEMGKVMKSGKIEDWEKICDIYIKLMDGYPQYIEHRIAVLDLFRRYKNGEINKFPETILSVASGPHEEARAHMDFEFLYEELGLKKPKIYNLDFSFSVLKKGEEAYIDKVIKEGKDDIDIDLPINIVGDMRAIPIKNNQFDLVECSSTDNLIKRSNQDIKNSLTEMIRVLKPEGLLRLSYKGEFPDELYKFLQDSGINLLTKTHTKYNLPPDFITKISEQNKILAKRFKQKISRGAEYILGIKELKEKENKADLNEWLLKPLHSIREKQIKEKIEKVVNFFEQNPNKGRASYAIKNLIRNIYLSLELDAVNGIVLKDGKKLEIDPLVVKDIIEQKHLRGGIPQEVNDLCNLERDYRVKILKKYGRNLYKDLIILNVIIEEEISI